jgi:hypothetical protein
MGKMKEMGFSIIFDGSIFDINARIKRDNTE